MSVDEIDTILLIESTIANTHMKGEFYSKITYKRTEINKNKKFSIL